MPLAESELKLRPKPLECQVVLTELSILIDEQVIELKGAEKLACLAQCHPSLLCLVMKEPEAEAAHLITEKLTAVCLLVAGSDLVQVDLVKVVEVKRYPLCIGKIPIEWMN